MAHHCCASTGVLLLILACAIPGQAAAQEQEPRALIRTLVPARPMLPAPLATIPGAATVWTFPPTQRRVSPARAIAIHGLVGAGAGLLIGTLLSGAAIADDRSTVVLTWTGIGAAAGLTSGVAVSLLGGAN